MKDMRRTNCPSEWAFGKPMQEASVEIYSPSVGMWRMNEFLKLGFDVEQAGFLSNSRTDLNTVRKALRADCTVEMAWEIFG